MEFDDVLRRRRSERRFDPGRPVPPELLDQVLAAALRAPTAGNTQGVTLLVLDQSEPVAGYWRMTAGDPTESDDRWLRGMRTAPVLVTVWTSETAYLDRYAESDKGWTDRDPDRWSAPYWWVDAGMAAMNVLLAAVDRGLGACFFGVPTDKREVLRGRLGVPAEQLSVGVIALGFAVVGGSRGSAGTRSKLATGVRIRRGGWIAEPPVD